MKTKKCANCGVDRRFMVKPKLTEQKGRSSVTYDMALLCVACFADNFGLLDRKKHKHLMESASEPQELK